MRYRDAAYAPLAAVAMHLDEQPAEATGQEAAAMAPAEPAIAPAPASPQPHHQASNRPPAAARPAPASRSLFQSVTRRWLGGEDAAPVPAPRQTPTLTPSATATTVVSTPVPAAPTAAPVQRPLSRPQTDELGLDIPAFLRRQAN